MTVIQHKGYKKILQQDSVADPGLAKGADHGKRGAYDEGLGQSHGGDHCPLKLKATLIQKRGHKLTI